MQRRTSGARFQKADGALLVAGIGLITTIMLSIFSLADGLLLVTPTWVATVIVSCGGLLACWFWPPSSQTVAEAIRGSCGVWAIVLVFASMQHDWREGVPFALLLLSAVRLSAWLQRRSANMGRDTRGSPHA